MNTGKDSRYAKLAELLEKISKQFSGMKPEAAEKKLKLVILQNLGSVTKALVDLAVNPTAEDLALMTTFVKVSAEGLKIDMLATLKGDMATYNAQIKKIVAAEKAIQSYYKLKAGQLKGGKTQNKELIDLITANIPSA